MIVNPLNPNPRAPEVHVVHGADAYANTMASLKDIDLSLVKGTKVLLKPNVGRMSKAGTGVNTNPQVVAAALDAFRKAGAAVAIGESPITGVNTLEAFELSGMSAMAKEKSCPLIDMD
ncbi:MAG: DUF362 domain-containing protein, partial [Pontiella sp.]|nr:DUF362 domain-containing protein [Pontiella sp.]